MTTVTSTKGDRQMPAAASTEQQQSVVNELNALTAERDQSTGARKGVLTKRIKQIESQLELAQLTGPATAEEAQELAQVLDTGATKPKPRKTTKFDSELIVAKAADAADAEQLAEACGYELDANLRRRISWLVKHDHVLDEKFLSVKPRPARKQVEQQEQPVAA